MLPKSFWKSGRPPASAPDRINSLENHEDKSLTQTIPLPRVVIYSCGHSSPRPDSVSGDGGENNNVWIPRHVPHRGFVVWLGGRSRMLVT
ncbi:hypothetical protein PIB30_089900 [Stylosanthes scabra]|uniref:Uncharacterized protein n=1 Tax=Stylosanthes scabra TaxID=79078 RepID=A0ABU6YRU2_9FABA|nr:hypothetical protein [Stylosanthes scabra]